MTIDLATLSAPKRRAAAADELKFPLIDVLRGFAAVSVLAAHVIYMFAWTAFPTSGPLAWFRIGWLGVDLFFVISGLVIGLSAFVSLDRDPANFRPRFVRHRLWRIAPLYLLTAALFVILVQPALMRAPDFLANAAVHLGFIHNFWPTWSRAINAPSWSIGVEMQFYLLVLLAAPWLRRADWRVILAASLGIAWTWRLGAFLLVDASDAAGAFRLEVAANQLPGVLDEFGMGVVMARWMLTSSGRRFRADPWRSRALTGIASVALVWAMLAVFYSHPRFWDWIAMVTFFRTLAGLAAASLILWAIGLGAPTIVWLATPLRYLGRISYGIYLWHMLVIDSVRRMGELQHWKAMALVLGLTGLLAIWSWHFFEEPLLRKHAGARRPSMLR